MPVYGYGRFKRTVDELANRLRLIQVDLADEDGSVRREYIENEIDRVLSDLVPDDRLPFLNELAERFPSAPVSASEAAPAPAAFGGGASREAEPGRAEQTITVADCLAILSEGFEDMDFAERDAVLGQLLSGDLGDSVREHLSVGTTGMGISAETVETEVQGLVPLLAEFLGNLEKFLVETLSQVAPGKGGINRGNIAALIERARSGDETALAELKKQLFMLRSHTAALLAAIPQAGRLFAKQHVAEFTPEAIQELVRLEGKSFMTSWEVAYWTKYCDLAERRLRQDAIEQSILDNIANYVERLLRSRS